MNTETVSKTHTVRRGESLNSIAFQHYGSAYRNDWMKIYEANKEKLTGKPWAVRSGQELFIPPMDKNSKSKAGMPKATSIETSGEMIEDRLYFDIDPVAALPGNSLFVLNNPNAQGQTEIIALSGDSRHILHYFPSSESDSGWQTQKIPFNFSLPFKQYKVQRFLAAYQGRDLYIIPIIGVNSDASHVAQIYLLKQGNASRVKVFNYETIPTPKNIVVNTELFNTSDGRLFLSSYAYATSSYYLFELTENGIQSNQNFAINVSRVNVTIPSAIDPSKITILAVGGAGQGQSISKTVLVYKDGKWDATPSQVCTAINECHPYLFTSLPGIANNGDVLLYSYLGSNFQGGPALHYYHKCSGNRNFSMESLFTDKLPNIHHNRNSAVLHRSLSLGIDQANRLIMFAADPEGVLWIRRQVATNSNGSIRFGEWVELGIKLNEFYCPPVMSDGPEFFYINEKNELAHVKQDLTSSLWVTDIIESPTPSNKPSVPVTTFNIRIRSLTKDNTPAPNRPVALTANRKTIVVANNLSHHVDEFNPAFLQTNSAGILCVKMQVDSLASPEFRFHLPDYMEAGEYESLVADKEVFKRLSGKETSFQVTAQSLKNAGIIPPELASDQAEKFASALKDAGKMMLSLRENPGSQERQLQHLGLREGGWQFTFKQSEGLQINWLLPEEVNSYLSGSTDVSTEFSFFSHVGDFLYYLVNKGKEIISLGFKLAKEGFTLIVNLAGKLFHFVVSTVSEIADSLKALFIKIGSFFKNLVVDVFEKVIEWLMELFNWEDILNTEKVMSYVYEEGVNQLKNSIGYLQGEIHTFFEEGKMRLTEYFSRFEQIIGDESFMDLGGKYSVDLTQPSYRKERQQKGVQMSYILDHFVNWADQSLDGQTNHFDISKELDNSLTIFLNKILKAEENPVLKRTQTQLQNYFEAAPTSGNYLSYQIIDLAEIIKDFLLVAVDILESISEALFTVILDAFQALENFMNRQISIPIISDIYHSKSGHPLTIKDLSMLLAALPTTVLYKLLNHRTPPFTPKQVKTILSTKISFPFGLSANNQDSQEEWGEVAKDHDLWRSLSLCSIEITAFRLLSNTLLTIDSFNDNPLPGNAQATIKYVDIVLSFLSKLTGLKLFITGKEKNIDLQITQAYYICRFFSPIKSLVFQILKQIHPQSEEVSTASSITSFLLGGIYLGFGLSKWTVMTFTGEPTKKEKLASARGIVNPLRYISQITMLFKRNPELAWLAAINIIVVPAVFLADTVIKGVEYHIEYNPSPG